MNAFLLHGTGGNPDECFFPWLRKELEKIGYAVYAPQLPLPQQQSLKSWMSAFAQYEECVDANSIFVGRSIAPAFILRLLERNKIAVKAAFLVAGFCSDIGLPAFTPLIRTFIVPPFNWKKIRGSCSKFFVYNSDNDPYVPLENGKELAKKLGVELRLVPGAEHFWMQKFQQLLEDVKNIR
jgi:uncharacterized protein